jgi:hypothetical protein
MNTLRILAFTAIAAIAPLTAVAADFEIYGTYSLVGATSKVLDTGEIRETYGADPKGFITYGRDGRMLVLLIGGHRPKAESLEKMTDQQRADLFRSMQAYGGTYTFDGKSIQHHVDISANEVWTGTTVTRDIRKEGDRLVYTTRPSPATVDGKMVVTTLVWEKVK